MKVSPSCGTKYDSDAYAFCKACGTRLVDCDEPLEEDGDEGKRAAATSGAMDSLIAMGPQDLTITGDGKAVYAPGAVLMLDNLADFLFLVERSPFTWWMTLLLVLAGFTFVGGATGLVRTGANYETDSLLLVVVAYLVRRALAKKTLVFSMSSGDRAKVVSRDEADLRKAFGIISKAVVSREAFEYTFASAEVDVTGK